MSELRKDVKKTRRHPRTRGVLLCFVAIHLAVNACNRVPSEETVEPGIGSVVVTQRNDATELFLEYPHPVAGQPTGNWAIHLTSMETFEPIRSGSLVVSFLSAESVEASFTIEGVARDGIFILDPVVAPPGDYRVELALDSPQAKSSHVLPNVQVFASESEAPLAEEAVDAGGIAFLKEQQWQIPWAVAPAEPGSILRTIAVPGQIVAPDGSLVQVGAPVAGIALEESNRTAPSVGQNVTRGQVLAVLAPTAQEGGFARTVATVQRLEREVQRTERLVEVGAIPRRRLEEARHDLEVARDEAAAMGALASDGPSRLQLTSPMTGVVATRSFMPGGRVEAGEPLFTIVDPGAAWLRLAVPSEIVSSVPEGALGRYRLEGSEEVRETGRLVSIGAIVDLQTRTVPVVFDVSATSARFVYGQLAEGFVPLGGEASGIVIPNEAIIDDNGTDVAYVQTGGETFERRILSLGPTDGSHTLVQAGIIPGEMIVVKGAYQVRLASMSGSEFAGAHTH